MKKIINVKVCFKVSKVCLFGYLWLFICLCVHVHVQISDVQSEEAGKPHESTAKSKTKNIHNLNEMNKIFLLLKINIKYSYFF